MSTDDRDVRAVESAYDSAWNAGDIDALLACFTDDAVVVNPRGEAATGIDEIRIKIGGFMLGEARGSTHEGRIERIAFATPDVAIVDGVARITGGSLGAIAHRFIDVVVRRDGRWRLAHVRACGLDEPGS